MISPPPETGHEIERVTNATTVENAGVKRVLEEGYEPTADEPADIANVGDELTMHTLRSRYAPSDPALEIAPISSAETNADQRMTKRRKGSI